MANRHWQVAIFFKFIYLFLRERENPMRGRDRGREDPMQASHCQGRAQSGAQAHPKWGSNLGTMRS